MPDLPGIVLDTGTVLQAGLRPTGPAGRLLSQIGQGVFTLYVSQECLTEYEDVLSRPTIRAKNPYLTSLVAAALVERIHRHAILVPTVPSHFQYPRDPDDEHILNLAVEVGARYIVSRDKDLLDLMADRPEGLDFRLRFPQLLVLDPVALLRDLALLSKPETDQE